jgi:hypothetical protein
MQPLERNRLSALQSIVDGRGQLVVAQAGSQVPFEIQRVYCIIGKAGQPRGFHAHRRLTQMLVCLSGSCRIKIDNGFEQAEWLLNRPDQGLLIGPMEWREMHDFSDGAVLMCLADTRHDEADYIRDYAEFRELVGAEISS